MTAHDVPPATVTVKLVAFARLAEVVGARELRLDAPATAGRAWDALCRCYPDLGALREATRLVVNGRFAEARTALADGDELALLPPFGGG